MNILLKNPNTFFLLDYENFMKKKQLFRMKFTTKILSDSRNEK